MDIEDWEVMSSTSVDDVSTDAGDDTTGRDGNAVESSGSNMAYGDFDESLIPQYCTPSPIHRTTSLQLCISEEQVLFDSFTKNSKARFIKLGDTVELGAHLEDTANERCGDFLRVRSIFTNLKTLQVTLRGQLFKRTNKLHGMLPKKLNEVFLVLRQNALNDRINFKNHLVDVPLTDVVRKRSLIITNYGFPAFSYRCEDGSLGASPTNVEFTAYRKDVHHTGKLICRWLFSGKVDCHWAEESILRRVRQYEADPGCDMEDHELFRHWRGSHTIQASNYSSVDICCGAGGVSTGASHAGFYIKAALDKSRECCETFARNHPTSEVFNADISHTNVETTEYCWQCEHAHFSPPCQPYSPANTQSGTKHHLTAGGHRDEMNQAALFAIRPILRSTRARVLTIEETFGLSRQDRHKPSFWSLIGQIVDEGWSVRWKVLDFAQYGLPQHRKRLIVFAACPGGILPQFPAPSYGPGTGRRFRTIIDAIGHITPGIHSLHDTQAARRARPGLPFPANSMLGSCITTQGNYDHPDGTRHFTLRELACLQGFPVDYEFYGKNADIRTQIGNAVPPLVMEKLMFEVRAALKKQDDLAAQRITG